MKRRFLVLCASASMAIALCGVAGAQGGPQDQPQGRPGMPPGGAGRSGMHRMQIPGFELSRLAGQISMLNADKAHALTRDQSRAVLKLLYPLRDKPKLPAAEAKEVTVRLRKVLTKSQLETISKIRPQFGPGGRRQMPQGERRNGQMQQRGPGSQGENQTGEVRRPRRFDPEAMKDFNPFYAKPAKGDPMAERMSHRWDDFFKDLWARAGRK